MIASALDALLARRRFAPASPHCSHKHTRAESLLELLPQARIRHRADCGHFPDLEAPTDYAALIKEHL